MNKDLEKLIYNTHDYSLSMDEAMLRDRIRLMNELIKDEDMRLEFDDMGKYCTVSNSWIDLDKTTPVEIFTDKKYTIELLVGDEWDDCDELTPQENMINFLQNPDFKYRYRIQENKEPMRITQDLHDYIVGTIKQRDSENFSSWNNRKVIIID